ncbi:MAG: hypothetical protein ACRDP5_17405, partial [Streptosporangiaceae bacterium]
HKRLTSGNSRPRYTPSIQETAHSCTSNPRFADQHATQLRNPGGTAGYHHILEALVWHSASEFGVLLARIDPSPAHRLVADIEKIPAVVRALHHREFLDDVAPFVAKVAEVVADVDVAIAEELVRPMGTPARDMALAQVAMAAARTGSTRAGPIAATIIGRRRQTPDPDGWEREAPPPPSVLNDPNLATYWKVRALTELAIAVASCSAWRLSGSASRRCSARSSPASCWDRPCFTARSRRRCSRSR